MPQVLTYSFDIRSSDGYFSCVVASDPCARGVSVWVAGRGVRGWLGAPMTVQQLITLLSNMPQEHRVVAEYDGELYPVIGTCVKIVPHYPTYDLQEGEQVVEIIYEEYQ